MSVPAELLSALSTRLHPWHALIVAAVALGLFGSGLYVGVRWERGSQALEAQGIEKAAQKASQAAAEQIARLRTNTQIQTETLSHAITTSPDAYACPVPADGVRAVNAAIAGTEPADHGKLPAAPAAD